MYKGMAGGLTDCGMNDRTLVCVEGDATMQTYEDAEGKNRTALNIVQRESSPNPCPRVI